MSSTLADELLKTRTISELRDLCYSLSQEALNKQTDLQSMVGGQYREFIQSADKIAKMYEQTKEIKDNLNLVFQENDKLCSHLSLLLQNKNTKSISSTTTTTSLTSSNILTTSSISSINFLQIFNYLQITNLWKDLNSCNYINATEKILLSYIFTNSNNLINIIKLNYLTSYNKEILNYYNNNNNNKYNIYNKIFYSINQLYNTIILDCQTFLYYNDLNIYGLINEKGQALASYSLLIMLESINNINNKKKLPYDVYIEAIELKLEEIYENKLKLNFETGMIELVYLLQATIMELYILFFMPLSISSDFKGIDDENDDEIEEEDDVKKNKQQKLYYQFTGLVHFYEFYTLVKFNLKIMNDTTLTSLPLNDFKILYNEHKLCRETHLFNEKLLTFLPKKLIEIQSWLQNKLKISTEKSSKVLQTLKNALQVANLQQKIYQNCLNLTKLTANFSSKILKNQLNYEGINSIWINSCRLFFTQSTIESRSILSGEGLHQIKQIKGSDNYRLLLWSTVFRISFLRQVERLLESSCEDILYNVSTLLLESLYSLGIVYEGEGVNSLHTQTNLQFNLHPTLGLKNSTTQPIGSFINSSQIFLASEKIRGFFEQSLSKLVQNVIFPIKESEKKFNELQESNSNETLSSNALLQTLKIYTSKLVGQFISLLRRIVDSLTSTLFNSQVNYLYFFNSLQNSSCFPPSLKSIITTNYSLYLTRASQQSQLSLPNTSNHLLPNIHSALILLGRLSWSLKCHCDATSKALDPFRDTIQTNTPENIPTNNFNNIISEEQFRSAFEIADADGDGIIINDEVTEALQALLLSETSTELYSQKNFSLKSSVSLTFDEFILIYGSENLPQDELVPLSRFHHSLDRLLILSHLPCFISWISSTSMELNKELEATLFNYTDNGSNINQYSLLKQAWSHAYIDDDGELRLPKDQKEYSDSGYEKIFYPSRTSSPLLHYSLNLSSLFNRYFISLDTLTDFEFNKSNSLALISKDGLNEVDQEYTFSQLLFFYSIKDNNNYIFNFSRGFQQLFIDLSLIEVHSLYSRFSEKSNEVINLQIYFDLQFTSQLTSRWFSQSYSLLPLFSSLSTSYISQIDPITEELLKSTIDISVKAFYSQHHLLLFSLPNYFNEEKKKEEQIPTISSVSSHFAFTASPSIPKCSLLPFAFNLSSSYSTIDSTTTKTIAPLSPTSSSTPSSTTTSTSASTTYESKLKQVVGNINEKTKKSLGFNLW